MIILQKNIFSKHQNKAEFKSLDDSEVPSFDFPGLRTSVASMTSTASMSSMTSTASFHHKNYWFWWLDYPWHQYDQYWPLGMEWIIKNPIFHWYLLPFLLEAVEASPSYFFQNWLMKLKCPNLLKPLSTIFQENYQPFCPSEPFRILRFQMRHPVSYYLVCW